MLGTTSTQVQNNTPQTPPISSRFFWTWWALMNGCTWIAYGIILCVSLVTDPPKEMAILGMILVGMVYLLSIGAMALLNVFLFEFRKKGRRRALVIVALIPTLLGIAWNAWQLWAIIA